MGRSGLGLSVLVLTVLVLAISPTAGGAPSAVFTVDSAADASDSNPGDTLCESDQDGCTLRAAIEESNALAGFDNIIIPSATYNLFEQIQVADDLRIIGAGAASTIVDGGDLGRVFHLTPGAGTVDISGLTIQNGSESDGGGILNEATLTVDNSTFSGNSASVGGGVRNEATLTVDNSTFSGNSASNAGGGIANIGSGSLTVINSTFSGNNAETGGGISNVGSLTVENSTFSGNSASGPGGGGGGIFNNGPALTVVTNSTFSGNNAESGGGISNYAGVTVTNSTFSGNSASGTGGAIFNDAGVTVTNSTFSGNSASNGGGVANGGTLTLLNTIVAHSPSGGNCAGTITDGGGNLQHPGTDCETTIASTDPLLDPTGLQDNGGPTKTIALQSGSPAIDVAVAANCPATDQRGVARPQGPGCDIGAYERQSPTAVLLRSLTATLSRRGVAIRWHAESAAQTLGFNLYRLRSGTSMKLNPALIRSVSGGTTSGHVYSWLDRSAPRAAKLRYKLQAVHLNGTRSWVGAASVGR